MFDPNLLATFLTVAKASRLGSVIIVGKDQRSKVGKARVVGRPRPKRPVIFRAGLVDLQIVDRSKPSLIMNK